uniref:Uncharacterized protein n=1 Tax=Arundo donax TaxID=35708 RepID=A0A0A8XYL5_ARUDO
MLFDQQKCPLHLSHDRQIHIDLDHIQIFLT